VGRSGLRPATAARGERERPATTAWGELEPSHGGAGASSSPGHGSAGKLQPSHDARGRAPAMEERGRAELTMLE